MLPTESASNCSVSLISSTARREACRISLLVLICLSSLGITSSKQAKTGTSEDKALSKD